MGVGYRGGSVNNVYVVNTCHVMLSVISQVITGHDFFLLLIVMMPLSLDVNTGHSFSHQSALVITRNVHSF